MIEGFTVIVGKGSDLLTCLNLIDQKYGTCFSKKTGIKRSLKRKLYSDVGIDFDIRATHRCFCEETLDDYLKNNIFRFIDIETVLSECGALGKMYTKHIRIRGSKEYRRAKSKKELKKRIKNLNLY